MGKRNARAMHDNVRLKWACLVRLCRTCKVRYAVTNSIQPLGAPSGLWWFWCYASCRERPLFVRSTLRGKGARPGSRESLVACSQNQVFLKYTPSGPHLPHMPRRERLPMQTRRSWHCWLPRFAAQAFSSRRQSRVKACHLFGRSSALSLLLPGGCDQHGCLQCQWRQ